LNALASTTGVYRREGIGVFVDFVQRHEGDDRDAFSTKRVFRLDRFTWKDLGCPDEVTLTVVPGDTLND